MLPRIALLTVILMPLLYGAVYLWAFWNPFGEVGKVPVALVNSDTSAVARGERIRAGDEVASALIDSKQLDLHEVSARDADAGVASGKYYFSITLPAAHVDIADPHPGTPAGEFGGRGAADAAGTAGDEATVPSSRTIAWTRQ